MLAGGSVRAGLEETFELVGALPSAVCLMEPVKVSVDKEGGTWTLPV